MTDHGGKERGERNTVNFWNSANRNTLKDRKNIVTEKTPKTVAVPYCAGDGYEINYVEGECEGYGAYTKVNVKLSGGPINVQSMVENFCEAHKNLINGESNLGDFDQTWNDPKHENRTRAVNPNNFILEMFLTTALNTQSGLAIAPNKWPFQDRKSREPRLSLAELAHALLNQDTSVLDDPKYAKDIEILRSIQK